ncbi:amidohydrolase family protein [Pseudomaricurvus alkylphenolicus]|uniref:metal-dependent hydrolase family protein n=1 Tax=Pseudomaricurvus alkylphenolicus TaxID=1306991 RepID=UPI00141E23CB|nr:amidohydrolase family protein [Pseudomaricurvus alkylphenolicus]NIB44969.1 amidohydrolase family protein [Pseudomaricurvus alkylphenolicus]
MDNKTTLKKKLLGSALALLATSALAAAPAPATTGEQLQYIQCGKLLDVVKKKTLSNQNILVRNGVIEAMGAEVKAPVNAEQIDLSNQVCMPGLMDMHTHIFIDSTKSNLDAQGIMNSSADQTLMGLRNLQSLLNQGFTTIRIPGDLEKAYASISLKNAINRGEFDGPRMLVAPHALSPTGGHGDANSFAADSHLPIAINIVDGVDDIRRTLRTEFKYGADWIKIMATGGVMSQHDDPNIAAYSEEEFRVFAEEAHRHNKKITAHAHGDAGIRAAVEAGFDSIEHGTLMEKSTAKLMAKKGTYYVPTLYVLDWILEMGQKGGITANNLEKAKMVAKKHADSVAMAYKYGVKMALGSDPIFPMDQAIREFDAMAKRIPDNWYVLQMGTINSAEMLGLKDTIGSLEVGKQADIVATAKNPIDEMKNIESVSFVMKGGKVVRAN